MKKIILYIMLLLPFSAVAQQKEYILKGKLSGLNGPANIKINCYLPVIKSAVDSKDGTFEFKGTIDEPLEVQFLVNYKTTTGKSKLISQMIYLEPGTIILESHIDSLSHAKFTGSKLNTDNQQLNIKLAPLLQKKKELDIKFKSMSPEQLKDKALMAEMDKKDDSIQKDKKSLYLKFMAQNPNSFLSITAVKKYVGLIPDYKLASRLFNRLAPEVKATPTGQLYIAELESVKKTAIGNIAPDFTQFDVEGKPVKLSDFKGKYVLIDFWASWCGPCRAENPNVLKSYLVYHPKGLEILGVSLDIEYFKKNWLDAVKADKLPWMQVSDLKSDNEAARLYGIKAVPQNVLIDPQGKIIAKNIMGPELEKKLAEVFNKKS